MCAEKWYLSIELYGILWSYRVFLPISLGWELNNAGSHLLLDHPNLYFSSFVWYRISLSKIQTFSSISWAFPLSLQDPMLLFSSIGEYNQPTMLQTKPILTCLIFLLLVGSCTATSIFDTEIKSEDIKIFNTNTFKFGIHLMLVVLILLLVILLCFLHARQHRVVIGIIYKINCLAATIHNLQTETDRKNIAAEVWIIGTTGEWVFKYCWINKVMSGGKNKIHRRLIPLDLKNSIILKTRCDQVRAIPLNSAGPLEVFLQLLRFISAGLIPCLNK